MQYFFSTYGQMLLKAVFTHFYYVLISVSIGFCIALLLGILLSRIPKYSKIIIPIISIFQTIPGIVFIGILFIYIGMVPTTVIIALSIYAIFPILKNTYVGICEVPEPYKEAARGCGMSQFQILTRVELPIALPTIISGLRMSTVYTVSWAVLAAMIGLGGLGEFIYRGVGTNNNILIIAGAIPAAIMAICLGLLIDYVQKLVTPRGLREENSK
ncbi:ABC transporter permease subunit [Alkalibaculum sp. M08DMB]|uniref:ABC transporter permease subunit n=1 Tax=Alkalibaculum sporogenes TaxID=2655001 RepID=A0A6A7K5A4_9FIRM|nr:ABC transporter permease [Alkalibaculum sporogenes]MPW24588.1 ABC transporter permease subunit [Alkalibaculum sporogenes]